MHTTETGKKSRPEPFPAHTAADQGAAGQRRRVQRALPVFRLEQGAFEQNVQLTAGKRPSLAERRAFDLRPQAGAIGRHQQQLSFRRQYPPQLPEQRTQDLRAFQAMHHQNAIEKRVGKRQAILFREDGQVFFRRPRDHTHFGGRDGDTAFGLGQEGAQIGCGEAIPQQAHACYPGPGLAEACQDDAPGPLPQGAVIELRKLACVHVRQGILIVGSFNVLEPGEIGPRTSAKGR